MNGDVTYYIRYQVDGTDINDRVGRKSRGFTREMAKDALKSRLGNVAQGFFNLEKVRKPVPFSKLVERYKEFAAGYKCAAQLGTKPERSFNEKRSGTGNL